MIDLSAALTDPEMGFTAFTVQRYSYRRQNGQCIPFVQVLEASGCVHPGAPEMLQLLPEEDRHEEYIEVYTGFALNLGEDDGGVTYSTSDRILWNGSTWRVVKVRNWAGFGYVQALAVQMHE